MSIRCSLQGQLTALECEPLELPDEAAHTLTEVVCKFLYGAPLTPCDHGTLLQHCRTAAETKRALWWAETGPVWLFPHLERFATGRGWEFRDDASDDNRENTLRAYGAAQRWLAQSGWMPQRAHKEAVSAFEDIQRRSAEVSKRSELLCRELTTLAGDEIKLRGRPYRAGEPIKPESSARIDHEVIAKDYFFDRVVYDLADNSLRIDRIENDKEMMDLLYDRTGLEEFDTLIEYRRIQLTHEDATRLLGALDSSQTSAQSTKDSAIDGSSELPPDFIKALQKKTTMKEVHAAFEKRYPDGGSTQHATSERDRRIAEQMKADDSKRHNADLRHTINRYLELRERYGLLI